jgi:hypothetical protein
MGLVLFITGSPHEMRMKNNDSAVALTLQYAIMFLHFCLESIQRMVYSVGVTQFRSDLWVVMQAKPA